MTPEEIAENECEAHFFRISSAMLIRMLKGIFKTEAETHLKDDLGPHKESFTKAVEEYVRKFEVPTKEFFSIPKNVSIHRQPSAPFNEDPRTIEEEVKELEQTYKQHVMYQALLEQELKDLEKLEPIKENVRRLIQMRKDNQALFDVNKLQSQFNEILDDLDYDNLEYSKPC